MRMETYAVLGATGNIGNSILNVLFEDSSKRINTLVRSKHKLEKQSPQICASSRVTVFEGNVDDISTLQQCIADTRAVFLTVAASINQPGCRIAQDQAESVIKALQNLRQSNPHARLPVLIMLSSAETEWKFSKDLPWLLRTILWTASSNIYTDLIEAEKYLRSHEDWISTVFVKPGGLSHDKKTGHTISTEKQQTPISFLDLAGAMVEVSESDDGKWDGKSVSVLARQSSAFPWYAPAMLMKGLLLHFFPVLYSWIS